MSPRAFPPLPGPVPMPPPASRVPARALAWWAGWRTLAALATALGLPHALPAADPSTNAGVVFLPDKGLARFGRVEVDLRRRRVSVPARLNMTNGIIEYALVTDYGKTHESLFHTTARAMDLQAALLLLNARAAGTHGLALPDGRVPAESAASIRVAWSVEGRSRTLPLEDLVRLRPPNDDGNAPSLAPGPWLFNGSTFSPEGFVAHFEGSLISLIRDAGAILNNPRPDRDDDEIHIPAADRLPALDTEVTIHIAVGAPASPSP